MGVPLAESILKLCKEGLSAYKTYLATRQEAYNRQKDKEQERAIESAERYIHTNDIILAGMTDENEMKFKNQLKVLKRHRTRFFKYN
jgi:hypothetical protein